MDVTALLREVVDGKDRLLHECRSCGTTLGSRDEPCPYCGPTEVATYELRG